MHDRAIDLIDAFRLHGMKITPQRQMLCSILSQTDDHPTVDAIYARAVKHMPTISLKTVYTTLGELTDFGRIRLISLGTGSVRVCRNLSLHAHLVCKSCGRIDDYPLTYGWDQAADRVRDSGFDVEEREVIYRGTCSVCQAP